jgi:glycosyltransferase involved in cell wall biosynthesis
LKSKVSIIIPVYNSEKYLDECLTSVVNQTLKEIEIICVNDGSADGSKDILQTFASRDDRIRVADIPNSGQGEARNTGIQLATGTYIGFVDSDDCIEPEMFETLYNAAEQSMADIAYGFTRCFSDVRETGISFPYYDNEQKYFAGEGDKKVLSGDEVFLALPGMTVVAWNKIYKKELVDTHGIWFGNGRIHEDIPFSFKAVLNASRICIVRKQLYHYRVNARSTMNSISRENYAEVLNVLRHTEQYIQTELGNPLAAMGYSEFKVRQLLHSLSGVMRNKTLDADLKNAFFTAVQREVFSVDHIPVLRVREWLKLFFLRKNCRRLFSWL